MVDMLQANSTRATNWFKIFDPPTKKPHTSKKFFFIFIIQYITHPVRILCFEDSLAEMDMKIISFLFLKRFKRVIWNNIYLRCSLKFTMSYNLGKQTSRLNVFLFVMLKKIVIGRLSTRHPQNLWSLLKHFTMALDNSSI